MAAPAQSKAAGRASDGRSMTSAKQRVAGAAEPRAKYVKLLEEHLKTWPKADTTDRAHLWLARVLEYDRDWKRAIAEYTAVRPVAEQSADAAAGLARAYRESLLELRRRGQGAGKPTSAAATAAVAALEASSGIKRTPPQSYSAEQLATVLAMANILLEYTDGGAGQSERLISAALEKIDQRHR